MTGAADRRKFPGVDFNFSQYIEDNVEEAASGVKGENSVKLFGGDLETLEKTANKIKDVMATVPGITDLAVFNSLGQPTVRSTSTAPAPRATAWRRATSTPRAGGDRRPGGRQSLRGRQRPQFPDHRAPGAGVSPEPGRDPSASPSARPTRRAASCRFPLTDVATSADLRRLLHLSRAAGALHPDQVQRARPRSGRRGAGGAAEGRRAGPMPGGYHLEWVGEFGNLQDAIARLSIVVPISHRADLPAAVHQFRLARDMLLAPA
jgi:cobalt-zinc-cadmium resistance protein CzcA